MNSPELNLHLISIASRGQPYIILFLRHIWSEINPFDLHMQMCGAFKGESTYGKNVLPRVCVSSKNPITMEKTQKLHADVARGQILT